MVMATSKIQNVSFEMCGTNISHSHTISDPATSCDQYFVPHECFSSKASLVATIQPQFARRSAVAALS